MGTERRAVATLLYDESFVDGALALGASIKAHLREKDVDLVTLATSGVPRGARQRLATGGWALHDVAAASRPSDTHVSNSRLRFAYSKLELWRLPYDVVVYADADAIALGPVDALFGCRASLCAVLRHGELLNSGVLVVRPDARVFEDMRAQADALPSYTGGDQGFLNSYYGNFAACQTPGTATGPCSGPAASTTRPTSSTTRSARRAPARESLLRDESDRFSSETGAFRARGSVLEQS